LTSVTDWADRVVQYGYDALGRLQTVTDRDGKTTTFAYDDDSQRITTITDANGHVAITMTYDAEGRWPPRVPMNGRSIAMIVWHQELNFCAVR
jgi:YD repeat-containing protein